MLQHFLTRQFGRIIRHGLVLLGLLARCNTPTRAGPACLLGLPSVSHEHKFRSTENRPNRRVAAIRPNKDAVATPPGEGVEFRLPALGLAYCPGSAVCGTTCSQPEGHSRT